MEWQQIQKKYQIETLCAKVLADKNLEDEKLEQLFNQKPLLHYSHCENIIKIKKVIIKTLIIITLIGSENASNGSFFLRCIKYKNKILINVP